jgi:hypothetical protein
MTRNESDQGSKSRHSTALDVGLFTLIWPRGDGVT